MVDRLGIEIGSEAREDGTEVPAPDPSRRQVELNLNHLKFCENGLN